MTVPRSAGFVKQFWTGSQGKGIKTFDSDLGLSNKTSQIPYPVTPHYWAATR